MFSNNKSNNKSNNNNSETEPSFQPLRLNKKSVPLSVPYDMRSTAKIQGAKWDSNTKRWYAVNGEKTLVEQYPLKPRVYLGVSFDEKDEAKTDGAWFDGEAKRWYIPENSQNEALLLQKYPAKERIYVDVSYDDRLKVKSLGGYWDGDVKKWFISDNCKNEDEFYQNFDTYKLDSDSGKFVLYKSKAQVESILPTKITTLARPTNNSFTATSSKPKVKFIPKKPIHVEPTVAVQETTNEIEVVA
jgi:hypothetical protein